MCNFMNRMQCELSKYNKGLFACKLRALSCIVILRVFVNKRFHLRLLEKLLIPFISTVRYSFKAEKSRGIQLAEPLKIKRVEAASHFINLLSCAYTSNFSANAVGLEKMIAYHLEAQRRQRVIDRKHEAIGRLTHYKVRNKSWQPFASFAEMHLNCTSDHRPQKWL